MFVKHSVTGRIQPLFDQILGRNPKRKSFVIGSESVGTFFMFVGEYPITGIPGFLAIGSSTHPRIYCDIEVGDLVTQPVFVSVAAGAAVIWALETYYDE
jgi:hypothetical protein